MTFHSKYLFFFDVETTGFDPIRNDLISLCVIVTDKELKPVATFSDTCRPQMNKFISDDACKIHGFSREMMAKFQPRKQFLKKLLWFLNDFRTPDQLETLVFHALRNFDWNFLEWCFKKEELQYSLYKMFDGNKLISTITMARGAGYSHNGLKIWADRLCFDLKHHDADSDTECCLGVYKYLQGEMNGKITNSVNVNDHAKKLFDDVGPRVES